MHRTPSMLRHPLAPRPATTTLAALLALAALLSLAPATLAPALALASTPDGTTPAPSPTPAPTPATAPTPAPGAAPTALGAAPTALGAPPAPIALDERHVTLANGVRVGYVAQGDPRGTPLLLLHGYLDSWRSFETLLPHLPPSIRVYAISFRGHGTSDKPPSDYTPHDLARDAALFLDAVGAKRAIVAGHSMGSFVAQRLALDAPDRVEALVLIGSFTTLAGHAAFEAFWNDALAGLRDPIDRQLAHDFQVSTIVKPLPPERLAILVDETLLAPAHVWREAMRGLMSADHRRELAAIDKPTLVVWGDRDQLFDRAEQQRLLAAIPRSRLVVVPGAGHATHWEDPERVAREIAAFVASVR